MVTFSIQIKGFLFALRENGGLIPFLGTTLGSDLYFGTVILPKLRHVIQTVTISGLNIVAIQVRLLFFIFCILRLHKFWS